MESMPHPSYKSHPIVRNHDSTIARITKLTTKAPKGRHDLNLNQGCNPWHLHVYPLPLLQERAKVRLLLHKLLHSSHTQNIIPYTLFNSQPPL